MAVFEEDQTYWRELSPQALYHRKQAADKKTSVLEPAVSCVRQENTGLIKFNKFTFLFKFQ